MIGRVARRVLGSAAGAVDRAATLAVQARNSARRSASMTPPAPEQRAALLRGFAELYPDTLGDDFFLPVRAISPVARLLPNEPGVAHARDLSWASDYQPFLPSMRERKHQPGQDSPP